MDLRMDERIFDYEQFEGMSFEARLLHYMLLEEQQSLEGVEELMQVSSEFIKQPQFYENTNVFSYLSEGHGEEFRKLLGIDKETDENEDKWVSYFEELREWGLVFFYKRRPVVILDIDNCREDCSSKEILEAAKREIKGEIQ